MTMYNVLSFCKKALDIIFINIIFLFDLKNYLISKKILKILIKRDMYIVFINVNAFGFFQTQIDYLNKYCTKKMIMLLYVYTFLFLCKLFFILSLLSLIKTDLGNPGSNIHEFLDFDFNVTLSALFGS